MTLRVLQVAKYYPPHRGGIERVVSELCQGLRERCRLEVLCFNDVRASVTDEVDGVLVHRMARWDTLFSVPLAPGMYFWMRDRAYDIVHLHTPNPLAELLYLTSGLRGPLVVTHHADPQKHEGLRRIYGPVSRRVLGRAGRIAAATPHHHREGTAIHEHLDKVRVVPFGIDLSPYQGDLDAQAERWRAAMGGDYFLFVGRLVPYKGLGVLVEAMRKVDLPLAIVGSGPFFANLQQLRAGVEDRVRLLGGVPDEDLPGLYRGARALVLPSLDASEAFGMVQIEAFAAGTPVVASNLATGVSWVNRHEETGLLVPPGEVAGLRAALQRLAGDPEEAATFGENARLRARQEFSRQRFADRTYQLYLELAGEASG